MRVRLNENIVNVLKFYLPNDYYLNPFLSPDIEPKFKNKISERIYELEQEFYSLKTFQIASHIYYSDSQEKSNTDEPEQVINVLKERDKLLEELISLYAESNKSHIFTKIYDDVNEYNVTYNRTASQNAVINKTLKKVAKKLNLRPFSFHSARHTFAYLSRLVKTDIYLISRCLGHSSLSITEQYLREFEEHEMSEANDQMVNLIHGMYKNSKIL
jgi:hypothetical protein